MDSLKEAREWIQLTFVVVGGFIALRTFVHNNRQRRLENALKLIALFKENLKDNDLEFWESTFKASSESAGAQPGHYVFAGSQIPIINLFSERSIDGGAISRMADSLEILCYEILRGTADKKYIWFELGQIMSTMHYWLAHSYISEYTPLITRYPSIQSVFGLHGDKLYKWPHRSIAYVE